MSTTAPTTSEAAAALMHAAINDPQVLDALIYSNQLGSTMGALFEKDEEPHRKASREQAKPVPPERMHGRGQTTRFTEANIYFDNACLGGWGGAAYTALTDDGLPVPKTKQMSPYAYSTFVQYDDGSTKGDPRTADPNLLILTSDRIIRHPFYDRLAKKHFGGAGHYWESRDHKAIEAFLCDITEKKVTLHRVLEGCNASNGYPFWLFKFTISESPN